jgi:hypothetical protein
MPETLFEALALCAALSLSALWSIIWRGSQKQFLTGTLAALAAHTFLWVWAKVSFVAPQLTPPPGVYIFVVFPIVEELVRAYAVYRVMPRFSTQWRDALAFAIGYASIESVYKCIVTVAGGDHSVSALAAPGLPFAFLVFISTLMSLLRDLGIKSASNIVCCIILHALYNIFTAGWEASSNPPSLVSILLASSFFGFGSLLALVAIQLRSKHREAPG